MNADAIAWQASASYLYVLHLDIAALAWEYLRRNRHYVAAWRGERRQTSSSGAQWGLTWLEDPRRDAREAQLAWDPAPDPLVTLTAVDERCAADRFSVWTLPGRKRLIHAGRRMLLAAEVIPQPLRVAFDPQLGEGERCAYLILSGTKAEHRWRAVKRHRERLKSTAKHAGAQFAASRESIVHMRTLQALDGKAHQASHREIAEVVFGGERVAQSWYPDSDLRAQVRHLLRRGEALVDGGYRALLGQRSSEQGDARHHAESPSARLARTTRLHPIRCASPASDRQHRTKTP